MKEADIGFYCFIVAFVFVLLSLGLYCAVQTTPFFRHYAGTGPTNRYVLDVRANQLGGLGGVDPSLNDLGGVQQYLLLSYHDISIYLRVEDSSISEADTSSAVSLSTYATVSTTFLS